MQKINPTLIAALNEANDLNRIFALVYWDKETNMPKGGLEGKIQQLGTLRKLEHEMLTNDTFTSLLEEANQNNFQKNTNEFNFLRHLNKKISDEKKLTSDFIKRSTIESGKAHATWAEARQNKDFKSFAPHLQIMIELCKEKADLFGYEDHIYSALLDQYEPGMQNTELETIFENLKPELIQVFEKIKNSPVTIDQSILFKEYDINTQRKFAEYIAKEIGYDFNHGHLGTVLHPFCRKISKGDVRITTRWDKNFLPMAIFGTLHEAGHGIYEQNINEDFAGTYLDSGTSMGIHESQSRLFENVVGRNPRYWEKHFPVLQELFPTQLKNHSIIEFTNAINMVSPSFIRVEADEVTYNLHILVRYELEKDMLMGNLNAKEMPEAWAQKMQSYLGITPTDDALGCLQDMHWTRPGFGYFPTYALGNLNASTIYKCAVEKNPAIQAEVDAGSTQSLKVWLNKNIHQHGKALTAKELLQQFGLETNHEDFIQYINKKYKDIYKI